LFVLLCFALYFALFGFGLVLGLVWFGLFCLVLFSLGICFDFPRCNMFRGFGLVDSGVGIQCSPAISYNASSTLDSDCTMPISSLFS